MLQNDTQGAEWLACLQAAATLATVADHGAASEPLTLTETAAILADKLYAEYRKRRDGS